LGLFRLLDCSEVILKTKNDSWAAGKFANLREFYVVLNTKNANLIEISGNILFYSQLMAFLIFPLSLFR
jgi:hypothetical protein